jgi:drug/metabolite transporter (DMT)-like permease
MDQIKMHSKNTYVPLTILIILGVIWGTGYSIARYAMTHNVSPLGYSFWQSLGPAIIITLITLIFIKTIRINKEYLFYYFASGLTGIAIPNTIMYYTAAHLPASILAIVVNTVPIVVYPLALYAHLEQYHPTRFFGVGLAVLALMILSIPKSSLPNHSMVSWIFLALIAPLSFAVCSIIIAKFRPKNSHTLELTSGMLIMSSLILMPIVYLTENFHSFSIPLNIADLIIILEIILSSIGYLLFFQLIKIAGPVYYSMVDTIVVVTGISWGYLIFNEKLNFWTGTTVLLIIIALWLVTYNQRESAEQIKHG